MEIREILEKLESGSLTLEEAEAAIKNSQYEDLGYAKIDHNRKKRMGQGEVVFCEGKPDEFLSKIYQTIYKESEEVLGTRATEAQYNLVKKDVPNVEYDKISRLLKVEAKNKEKQGCIAVCTGGTADIPVAEEAAGVAEFFGNNVKKIYDVGVSGIHRLLGQREKLEEANCIIVVAGMEGALATVVSGLVKVPVIAVPTSVGYGASFNGLAALLSMLNSCANGVSVVNIDNGFGAGYIASQINKATCKK